MIQKKKTFDLKKYYTIFFQTGLIITLSVLLIMFKVDLGSDTKSGIIVKEQEMVKMEEVIQTQQTKTPPPPPKPPVPVEVPNDEVIEEEVLNLNADINLDNPLDIPPPPSATTPEEEEEVFLIVENKPELIGGLANLQKKVNYPEIARKAGIEGRVVVQFVVDEKGNVVNPRVVRGIGGGCDEEALRVIKTAEFRPGTQRGRPVKVQYTLPINFKLTG